PTHRPPSPSLSPSPTLFRSPHPDAQWQALPSSDDGAWIASRAGLYHWNGQALQLYGNEQGAPAEVESMALDDTGRVWAGGGKVTDRKSTRLNSSHVKSSYAV